MLRQLNIYKKNQYPGNDAMRFDEIRLLEKIKNEGVGPSWPKVPRGQKTD